MARGIASTRWQALQRSLSLRLSLITAVVIGVVISSLGLVARNLVQSAIEQQWQSDLVNRLDSLLAYRDVLALTAIDPGLYGELYSGNYWESGTYRKNQLHTRQASISLADFSLADELGTVIPDRPEGRHFLRLAGPIGEPLLLLLDKRDRTDDPAWFLMARDATDLDLLLARVHRQMTMILVIIALTAILATVLAVLLGARPVRRLAEELGELDAGSRRRVSEDLPTEMAPLAQTLNRVMAAQEARIRRQRESAANLAHELKTPLAILQQQSELAESVDSKLIAEKVQRMWVPLEQELARARVHGPTPGLEPTIVVSQVERAVSLCCSDHDVSTSDFQIALPGGWALPLEQRDLFTVIWNLLDNAVRHGGLPIRIEARDSGLRISDNGRPHAAAKTPSTGAGLRLVEHILDAYNWRLAIRASDTGGRLCTVKPAT